MTVRVFRQIPLSEQTIARLEQLADPLDDTYDSVVQRLLDAQDGKPSPDSATNSVALKTADSHAPRNVSGIFGRLRRHAQQTGNQEILDLLAGDEEPLERVFNPLIPPNLTHTKLTAATLAGRPLASASWNGLLDEAVRIAFRKLSSFSELRKISQMKIFDGRKADEGYHFLSDIGVSVQGQDANDAWRCTVHIARQMGFAVDVHFLWRTKEGAAFPGSNGQMRLEGRS